LLIRKLTELSGEVHDAALWTQIEAVVSIFCACAPALKALVQRFAPTILDTITSQSQTYASFGSRKIADTYGTKSATFNTKSTGTKNDLNDIELGNTTHCPRIPEIWPDNNTQINAVLPPTESEEYLVYLKRDVNDGLPLSMIKS
jgi:hypothetical protein